MGKRVRSVTARAAIAVAASSVFVASSFGQAIPAFSGADGAGAGATGGRNGDVYHVTLVDQNFSDTRVGTLRYGITSATGPRTIVFDVGGTFRLDKKGTTTDPYTFDGNGWDTQSRLTIGSASSVNGGSNITIAGQTAPSPVTIMGGTIKPAGTNIIVRNVTVAAGYGRRGFRATDAAPTANKVPSQYVYDAFDISGTNVMLDHVTAVYGSDETVSCNELANNLSVQYCNISQGQNYPQPDAEATGTVYTGHALGSLLQAGSNAKISFHHNLYANDKGRLPRVGTEATKLTTAGVGAFNDFRNNVFYNWLGTAGTGAAAQASQNNFVGNYFLAGAGGDDVTQTAGPDGVLNTPDDIGVIKQSAGGTSVFNGNDSSLTKVYHSGNVKDVNKNGTAEFAAALANGDFGSSNFQAAAYAQTPYVGQTDTAQAAYNQVLNNVGARWWDRGAVDARLVNEVRTGTGKIRAWDDDPFTTADDAGNEFRALASAAAVTRDASYDTDGDGMADAWEVKYGLNPNVADNNGDFDNDGYTNLEEYINELAEFPASRAIVFNAATNNRYALITNWDLKWQPSKYDAARIVSGSAIVDAVGQHARTIAVGDTAGQSATLAITAGWIDVVETLVVGGAGTGTVSQSGGGTLVGGSVTVADKGTYALAGGSLATPILARSGSGTFSFTGGTLNVGEVTFDLTVAGTGTLAPGLGVGQTLLDGKLTMNDGALAIELASDTLYDRLVVGDVATLDGELRILAGYAPTAGATWTILTAAGGIVGSFDSITPGYAVSIVGNTLVLSLASVPEPTSLAAIIGVAAIVRRRRRSPIS